MIIKKKTPGRWMIIKKKYINNKFYLSNHLSYDSINQIIKIFT